MQLNFPQLFRNRGQSRTTWIKKERTRNTAYLFTLFAVFALVIFARLVYIQVIVADDLAKIALEQRQSSRPTIITARRGSILDRNGMVLATTIDTVSIYANTRFMDNKEATAYYVAEILGEEPDYWYKRFMEAPENTNVCIRRYASLDLGEAFKTRTEELARAEYKYQMLAARFDPSHGAVNFVSAALSCINYDYEYLRVYPYDGIGSQVIGIINSEGVAICGLERQYDRILSGRNGEITEELGKDGTQLPNGRRTEIPKIDGEDIIISIDIGLQEFVESELSHYAQLGNTDKGSITVLDGATGEIYATASLPLYDRGLLTEEDVEKGALNLASITRAFEPGSTFKAVTAVSALEAGVVNTEEVLYVPSTIEVDGYVIKDWYDRYDQNMNLRQILLNSSNVGMTLIGNRMSNQALFDYQYKAGFYQPTHVDYTGLIGEPVYLTDQIDSSTGQYISIANKPELWSNVMAANLTFGQSLEVTALQVTSFYGALANDGIRYEPHFLINRPHSSSETGYDSVRIMSSQTAATMTDLLESVMTEGTGTPAAVPGYRIAGKTGTAEKADPDGGYSGDVVQSMVGYFIDSDCKLVVMTCMDDAGLVGNAVAPKPLFASAMQYIAIRYWV